MTYIDNQKGTTPLGDMITVPISGRIAFTNTPMGPGVKWSSGWVPRGQYVGAEVTIFSDVASAAGGYTIEYSEDEGATLSLPTINNDYTTAQMGAVRKGGFNLNGRWIRFGYTNGATAQTKFLFEVRLVDTQTQTSSETLNALGADSRMALWTKARVETKETDAGPYAPVYRTGNSLNVNMTNNPAISGTVALDSTSLAALESISVQNFPASQAVTGTFFQATQPVSGTFFQTLQPVSLPAATTATISAVTTVTANAAAVTVFAANTARKGVTIGCVSGLVYIYEGSGATAAKWISKLYAGGSYECSPDWKGIITVFSTIASTISANERT